MLVMRPSWRMRSEFHPKPTTRATWTYRVVKPADTDHATGVSPSRSVKVT